MSFQGDRRRMLQSTVAMAVTAGTRKSALGAPPAVADQRSPERLFYLQPAQRWNEALPIGNGRLGAMVFGGVAQERLQLNEDTLWAGSPYTPDNPDAPGALPEVRALIDAGKFVEADALIAERMMAKPVRQMPYGSMGDLLLTFTDARIPRAYERSLDLSQAVVAVRYTTDRGQVQREFLSSAVDGVLVARLCATGDERVSFDVGYRSPRAVEYSKEMVSARAAPVDWLATPSRDGDFGGAVTIASDDGRSLLIQGRNEAAYGVPAGLSFALKLTVLGDGVIASTNGHLSVRGASEVTLLVAAATSFVNFRDASGDPVAKARSQIEAASRRSYAAIRADHIADFGALFGTLTLDIGQTAATDGPTDQRLALSQNHDDPALIALHFQYGRYLLISSSRPGTQPGNLQGIWNEGVNPPWGSKYTVNINTQMNYWLADPAGLAPLVEPLVRMVEDLSVTGAKTAKTMYGAPGWVVHHNTDLWRAAAPVDQPKAGIWPTGGAWLCNALWDHWDYHRDASYLLRIYPLLRGATKFFLGMLVEDPHGRGLITSPSLSPENRHIPDISVCAGPAMDRQILRDLFDHTVATGTLLNLDNELLRTVAATRARLAPDRIGAQGQFQEWLDDWDAQAPDLRHRHVSQLYAVYPSGQVNVRDTPDLIRAAKVTLNTRGDLSTGWATAWRACLWARMGDGERAHSILREFVSTKRHYPNLFDAHPPFQIDGNFGGPTAVLEMLLQSWGGEIRILPALPKAWPSGNVRGVRARGGIAADIAWHDGRLRSLSLKGPASTEVKLRYGNTLRSIRLDERGVFAI